MTTPTPPRPPVRERSRAGTRPRALLVLAAAGLLGAVSACSAVPSGPALPQATGASPTTSAVSPSVHDRDDALLRWAACMRDHGVDVPDPEGGRITIDGRGLTPEQMEAAESACEEWQRLAGPEEGAPQLTAEDKQAFLDQAQCMRDRGWAVEDPEFGADGGVRQSFRRGSGAPGEPEPGDPRFEEDVRACADETGVPLPGGPEQEG